MNHNIDQFKGNESKSKQLLNRKAIRYFLISLVSISAIIVIFKILSYIETSSYYSDIELTEIGFIATRLNLKDLPPWEVSRIQKYDDHFIATSALLNYDNGVVLSISADSPSSYLIDNKEEIYIGKHAVTKYTDKKRVVYCTTISDAGLCFETPNDVVELVEEYIAGRE